jgi:hypothetical protein
MRRPLGARRRYVIAILAPLMVALPSTGSEFGRPDDLRGDTGIRVERLTFRIPAESVPELQRRFAAVPAPHLASVVADATCSRTQIESEGSVVRGTITCEVDFGCGELGQFHLDEDLQLFAPRGAGFLVAMQCPASIADPIMRAEFVNAYEGWYQRVREELEKELSR